MENQLLKKSGIIAAIITFAALGFWFSFSKISLGAYNEKNLTRQFLGEDSEVFRTIVIEIGTDTTARIIAGTSSMTRTGTSSYPGQPRIEYNSATGLWSFKNVGGTVTVAFGTISAAYVAAEIGSATANYVLKTDGSSTGQLATNATLAGSTTIGTGSTITTGTTTLSGTKVGYLADVTQPIETNIATKLTKVGAVTTYLGSVTAGGKTGTSSFSFSGGSNLIVTSMVTGEGHLAITADTAGSVSAKADIQIGGTASTSNASAINFPSRDFTGTTSGTVADLTFLHNVPAVMFVQSLIEYQRLRQGTLTNTFYGYSFVDAYIDNTGTGTTENCTWYGTPTCAVLMNYQPTTGSFTATAGGTSTSDSITGGFPALNACDGSETTAWYSITGAPPHWWKYDYGTGTEKNVSKLRVKPLGGTYGPQGFIMQGSNDNVAWTNIYTGTCTDSSAWQEFTFTNKNFCRMYRFYATSSYIGSGDIDVYEFEFIENLGTSSTASYQSKSYSFLEVPNRLALGLVMVGEQGSITAYISRDGGINYSTATVSAVGTSGYFRTANMVDVSSQPSSNKVQFKINFGSSTTTRITGAGIFGY